MDITWYPQHVRKLRVVSRHHRKELQNFEISLDSDSWNIHSRVLVLITDEKSSEKHCYTRCAEIICVDQRMWKRNLFDICFFDTPR
jgi:hypothetical protein